MQKYISSCFPPVKKEVACRIGRTTNNNQGQEAKKEYERNTVKYTCIGLRQTYFGGITDINAQ